MLTQNLPLTKQYLSMVGVFLYDNAEELIILVQGQAPPELLVDLFGT